MIFCVYYADKLGVDKVGHNHSGVYLGHSYVPVLKWVSIMCTSIDRNEECLIRISDIIGVSIPHAEGEITGKHSCSSSTSRVVCKTNL